MIILPPDSKSDAGRPALLTVALIVATLLPVAGVVWFMNAAIRNERVAARERLAEVCESQLATLARQLDQRWRDRIERLQALATMRPAAAFAELVRQNVADAAVFYAADGTAAYPTLIDAPKSAPGATTSTEAPHEERSAVALKAKLLRLKRSAPDAVSAVTPDYVSLVAHLQDYSDSSLSGAERRFLMHEVAALPGREMKFTTLAAEDLAAEYLESEPAAPAEMALERTALQNVLCVATPDRRLVALFREDRVRVEAAQLSDATAVHGLTLKLLAPNEPFTGTKLVPPREVGGALPGWRLAFPLIDRELLAEASNHQRQFHLWTGALIIVVMALLAWVVARTVHGEIRLARMKNELVSTVSHELKTPLASMRALVDTLAAGRFADERQLHEYLQLIARENARLSLLIDNFLTFSRLERGHAPFRFAPLTAQAVVTGAASALREKLNAPHCHFETDLAADLPVLFGDPDALTTVLINLIDNAWKYSDTHKRIRVAVSTDNHSVVFAVTDHGIGLAPAETKRIFERFYQVDQSLTRQRGGCGLGLSIVHGIVTAHGGTVEVESAPGRGSTFRVRLPAATAIAAMAPANRAVEALP